MIGEGGMATVYEAEHLHLQSRHAIKVLNPELLVHEDIRDRFRPKAAFKRVFSISTS